MDLLRILAIDPGPTESGFVVISDNEEIIKCRKWKNHLVHTLMDTSPLTHVVIEECICRKWAGREVSDSAFEAGRLYQHALDIVGLPCVDLITRSKVRWHICGARQANDSIIISKLIERKCPVLHDTWTGSRQKLLNAAKDEFFNGFSGDMWQAYALALTFLDLRGKPDA